MSVPDVEKVGLDQAFPLFPDGVREVRPPRLVRSARRFDPTDTGPPLFYGRSWILTAPNLPDLLFRGVISMSSKIQTSRHRQRLDRG